MKNVLAMYDISGIQNYIYSTKKLKENVGASIKIYSLFQVFLRKLVEETTSTAEIIYIGGGNAMIKFSNQETYLAVTKKLRLYVAEEMASLYIASAGVCYEAGDTFKEVNHKLVMALSKAKRCAERTAPVTSYPITRNIDKVPVKDKEIKEIQFYSKERICKLESYQNYFCKQSGDDFEDEFDEIVEEKGVNSYMAVVHIDGNSMGELMRQEAEKHNDMEDAFTALREFSTYITRVYTEACNMIKDIAYKKFSERLKDNKKIPFRFIVNDGDDITFVCQAKFAFDAARLLIQYIEKKKERQIDLTACAGIAFVNSKFPFNRAYEIAEECCRRAKERAHERGSLESYMDCYLVQDGMAHSVTQRWNTKFSNEFEGGRPWRVSDNSNRILQNYDFTQFCNLRRELLFNEDTKWNRSRLIQLRNLFLLGDKDTFIKTAESRGYHITEDFNNSGLLFDVLELMEFYEPLSEEGTNV